MASQTGLGLPFFKGATITREMSESVLSLKMWLYILRNEKIPFILKFLLFQCYVLEVVNLVFGEISSVSLSFLLLFCLDICYR